MKRFLRALLATMLVGALVVSAGCAGKTDVEMIDVAVSEVTHSLFYAPQYVALGLGYFAEEGLNVEFTNAGGADKVMTAVMSGDADIGFCGPEQTVYVYNQGQTNYPINFAQLTQCDGSFIIAREPSPDFDINELRGKHILGGRKGGMPVMALEYTLKANGIVPGVDCIVDTSIAFDALSGAFISGTGDYVSLFEPTAGKLEEEGHGYIVKSLGELSGRIPYTVYNARKEFIEANPDIIEKFVTAIKKGQEYVLTHTGFEVAEAVIDYFPDTTLESIATVVERYKSVEAYAESPFLSEESYARLLDILDSAGELTARPPYSDLVLTDFMD